MKKKIIAIGIVSVFLLTSVISLSTAGIKIANKNKKTDSEEESRINPNSLLILGELTVVLNKGKGANNTILENTKIRSISFGGILDHDVNKTTIAIDNEEREVYAAKIKGLGIYLIRAVTPRGYRRPFTVVVLGSDDDIVITFTIKKIA